jgi:hypothetical protein
MYSFTIAKYFFRRRVEEVKRLFTPNPKPVFKKYSPILLTIQEE